MLTCIFLMKNSATDVLNSCIVTHLDLTALYLLILRTHTKFVHRDTIACAALVFKNRLLGLANFLGGKMLTFS